MADRRVGFGLAVVGLAVLGITDASAQETVLTRPRPELDPLGIRAGAFLFYPYLVVQQDYNDNIFAEKKSKTDDFITSVQPNLSIQSDWNNHALNFDAGTDIGTYAENSKEDYVDWHVSTDGRVDIMRDIGLFAGGGVAQLHGERGDPDNPAAADEPTVYHAYTGFLSYVQNFDALSLTVTPEFLRRDYDNPDAVGGGKVDQDDRDRNVYQGTVRLGYQLDELVEPFITFGGEVTDYDRRPDNGGFDRDNYGLNGTVGTAFDLGGITFGEVYAGVAHRDYPNDQTAAGVSNLPNITTPLAGGSLTWNPTTLTTVTGRVDRAIRESTQADVSAYVATVGTLNVDHELLRNLLLNLNFAVANNDYEGTQRNDYVYTAGIGARYMMFRNFYASLDYRYRNRDSNNKVGGGSSVGSNSYEENRVRITLQAQL